MSDPEKLARLKAGINMMLESALLLRGVYEDDPGRPDAARRLLAVALDIATTIVGVDALDDAMMRAEDGEGMLLLANRLPLLRPLIDRNWPSDFSYDGLIEATFAVAGGDDPDLFVQYRKGRQGKRATSFGVAEWQMKALIWGRILERRKARASAWQSTISDAFGRTWGAIYKWNEPLRRKFGQDEYKAILAHGERIVDLLPDGTRMSDEEVASAIKRDGAEYQRLIDPRVK